MQVLHYHEEMINLKWDFLAAFFHAGLAFVSELVVRYVLILMKNMHEVYYDEAN